MQDRAPTIGFFGLGVMGGPMCRNVARKHAGAICAFDLNEAALRDVAAAGVRCARSVAEVAGASDIIFLSLPGGKQVEEVCFGKEGVAVVSRRGRSEEHTSELQSHSDLVCRLLLEKQNRRRKHAASFI